MNYIRVGISVQATVCQYIPSVSLQFRCSSTGKEAMPTSGQQKESNDNKEASNGRRFRHDVWVCCSSFRPTLSRHTHTPGRFSVSETKPQLMSPSFPVPVSYQLFPVASIFNRLASRREGERACKSAVQRRNLSRWENRKENSPPEPTLALQQ